MCSLILIHPRTCRDSSIPAFTPRTFCEVQRVKLGVAAAAGALAALGGALYAHNNTYIEPRNFDIVLGVHTLAYGLIGARAMTRHTAELAIAAALALAAAPAAALRLDADVDCKPTKHDLVYDCRIALKEAKSGKPVSGAEFSVGADMPSMPMAHNVGP